MTQDILTTIRETYRCFNHADVDDVLVGPRREVTLIVSPLIWRGDQGTDGERLAVRFGGIEDFRQVAARFRNLPSLESEIRFLGPDTEVAERKGGLHYFRFESERRDFEFSFCCSSVTITSAEDRT